MTSPASSAAPPIELDRLDTLPRLFRARVAATPQAPAYRAFDPATQAWRTYRWAEIAAEVERWIAAFTALELPRGARVAILLPNGIHSVCADQAALACALTPVPLHAIDTPGSLGFVLADSEASVLIVGQYEVWRRIAELGAPAVALKQVVVTAREPLPAQDDAGASGVRVQRLDEWLPSAAPSAAVQPPTADDLAAIVYTSGTTGRPKGVMLSHRNVLANLRGALARVRADAGDVFLSFLPLSHTFERTVGYYLPIAAGSMVAFARSPALLLEDFASQRPTVLVSVPRIYERVVARLQAQRAASHPLVQKLFDAAVDTGWRRFRRAQRLPVEQDAPALRDALVAATAGRLVGGKVRRAFGGRLRVAVSGGAPLPPNVARQMLGLGVPVVQGYGLTESAPIIAANALDDNDPSSVGRPLADTEVRFGERQELEVRSASVMRGYWKRPEDTRAVLSEDGWLATGDQAELVQGRLKIVGRVKDIIVTSTGEKIAPVDVEQAITADPLFEQALVVGEGRPFMAAVVVLKREAWLPLARTLGLDAESEDTEAAARLAQQSGAREALLRRIAAACLEVPHYAVPRVVWPVFDAWTMENGLMTPTLKLKRNALMKRYEAEIAALFASRVREPAALAR